MGLVGMIRVIGVRGVKLWGLRVMRIEGYDDCGRYMRLKRILGFQV